MPNLTGPLVLNIAYDGLCTFEFSIAAEIFGLPRPEMGTDWYRYECSSIEDRTMKAHGGLEFSTQFKPELFDTADYIVLAGWKGPDVKPSEFLIDKLRSAHNRGARIITICGGSFVLAHAGLLENKTCTTHWHHTDKLRKISNNISVNDTALYIREDNIFTSAGSAAGIDLLLHIVEIDYGIEAATKVAKRLIVPLYRDGGQAQFIDRNNHLNDNNILSKLIEKIRKNPQKSWTISEMASQSAMSERSFIRKFKQLYNDTPNNWLIGERINLAKKLLENSNIYIEDIAHKTGFGSALNLRHHFKERVLINPLEYRQRFRA